jgi:hypothetical protein
MVDKIKEESKNAYSNFMLLLIFFMITVAILIFILFGRFRNNDIKIKDGIKQIFSYKFIIFSIVILLFLNYSLSKIPSNEKTNLEKYSNQLDDANIKCPDLKCRSGPRGRRGEKGGTFTDKGLLMNLNKKDMVVDRYAGFGDYANAYLTTGKNYKPQQIWTLHSSSGKMANKLENGYGGCLNTKNKKVLMDKCSNAIKWKFTTQGSITPSNDSTQCLNYNDNDGKLKLNKCPKKITNKYQWAFI